MREFSPPSIPSSRNARNLGRRFVRPLLRSIKADETRASPNPGKLVRPGDKSRALRRLDWARFPRSFLLSKREFGFEFASDPGLSKARLTSEDGEWKGGFVGTKEVGGGGEFMLGNLVEKFGRPLSFRNYHSIVEMGNSRGRERILVNAVGPRAPQGLAKVSAEHFSVNSRQVEIGSIVCAIVGRAREWRMRTAIPARRLTFGPPHRFASRAADSIKAGIVF